MTSLLVTKDNTDKSSTNKLKATGRGCRAVQIEVGWMPLRPRFKSMILMALETRNSLTTIQVAGGKVACKAAYNIESSEML